MKNAPKNFANEGFGWYCIRCFSTIAGNGSNPRILNEGEAESNKPDFSQKAMAKWSNPERSELICPVCGVSGRFAD